MVKNHEAMKLGNQLIILRAIREQGPVTRVDLQKMTNLGWGTVTTSVNDFLQKGIISEIGSIQTGVGRRPISLDLNTSRNYVVGLRIGRTKTRSLLMDVKGKVIGEVERPVEGPDVEKLIRSFFDVIDQVLEDNAIGTDRLAGIGVAAVGAVDLSTSTVTYAPNFQILKGLSIKKIIEQRYRLPCFVDHTSNCYVLAEKLFGAGQGKDNFLGILIGSGVSTGIVINGEVYRGFNYASGEIGHITIKKDGEQCDCGNKGCLELFASGASITRRGREVAAKKKRSLILSHAEGRIGNITGREVYLAAKDGDPDALNIFRQAGDALGLGISYLINLLNPELIVLAGEVVNSHSFFMPSLLETLNAHSWPASSKRIEISSLHNPVCMGAGANVLNEIFNRGLLLRTPED